MHTKLPTPWLLLMAIALLLAACDGNDSQSGTQTPANNAPTMDVVEMDIDDPDGAALPDTVEEDDILTDSVDEPDLQDPDAMDESDAEPEPDVATPPPTIASVLISPNQETFVRGDALRLRALPQVPDGQDIDDLNYTYQWTQTQGPALEIDGNGAQQITLTIPGVLDAVGEMALEVTANDGAAQSDPFEVRWTVANIAPQARVQALANVSPGQQVTLSGAESFDLDGDALTYRWAQRSGPEVALSDPSAQSPSFIAPAQPGELGFELVVNDGLEDSQVASAVVAVTAYTGQDAIFERNPFWHLSHQDIEFSRVTWSGQTLIALTGDNALITMDFSDPLAPQLLGTLADVGPGFGIALIGQRVFVRGRQSITAVDIGDLSNPARLGEHTVDIGLVLSGMTGHGDLLATANSDDELLLIDVSDPINMTTAGTIEWEGDIGELAFAPEGVLLVGSQDLLTSLDVSDPANPITLQELEVPSERRRINSIVIDGSRAWISHGSARSRAIDISDPQAMAITSTLRWTPNSSVVLAASGDRVVVRDFLAGVGVFDVSDLNNPRLLHNFADVEHNFHVRLLGERLVTSWPDGGVMSLRWNQPNPWLADHLIVQPTTAMAAQGDTAVFGWNQDFQHGLYVLDASNPDDLQLLTASPTQGNVLLWPIAIQNNALYTCNTSLNRFNAWDLTNPAQPTQAAELSTNQCSDLGVAHNGHLYSARSTRAFNILDTSQPLAPTQAGTFNSDVTISTTRHDMAVHNGYLFHVGFGFGLEVYDLQDPIAPVRIGRLSSVTDSPFAVIFQGDRAYVSADTEIWTVDISQPDTPRILGRVPLTSQRRTDRDGHHMALVGDMVVVDLEYGGLALIDIESDNRPRVMGKLDTLASGSIDFRDRITALPGGHMLLRDAETVITTLRAPTKHGNITDDAPTTGAPEQTLTVVFEDLDPAYELACAVSGGTCQVTDIEGTRATIEWQLPQRIGQYELAIAHGNDHFWIIDDRLQVTVQ